MKFSTANPFHASLAAVLARSRPLGDTPVPFAETPGRILAEHVPVTRDDPPADCSAMDGYALRAADTDAASPERPLEFSYQEVVGAGHIAESPVAPGGSMRIMTGAAMPHGADAVVKLEDTRDNGAAGFLLSRPLHPGENVIPRGSRMGVGERLLRAGDVLTPQAHGMLATLGRSSVRMFHRPRVGLLALGDELVPAGQPLKPGQIHVSNLYMLDSLVRRYGGEPVSLGVVGDDLEAIERVLDKHLPGGKSGGDSGADQRGGAQSGAFCDIVVTLGGSMRGDFDFVGQVLQNLGAEQVFDHTRMNPGRSTHFGVRGGCLIFGLPGTPAASWISFEVLVRPALWRMAGRRNLAHPTVPARLTAPIDSALGHRDFEPALLRFSEAGEPSVTPLHDQPHVDLPPVLLGNALIACEEEIERIEAGATVSVMWLGD